LSCSRDSRSDSSRLTLKQRPGTWQPGQRLSEEAKSAEAQIQWRAIAGFRNILVHDDLGLDMETIWNVVEKELPPLRAALERLRG